MAGAGHGVRLRATAVQRQAEMEMVMREDQLPTLTTDDVVIAGVLLTADQACARWAQIGYSHDGADADLVVTVRGGMFRSGRHPVTSRVVRQGLWRIGLRRSDDLPPGVSPMTQQAVLRALIAGEADDLWLADVDRIIQVGLFGEALL